MSHLGVPNAAHDVEASRLALLVEACLAAISDPTQDLDHDDAVEILRVHARHLELLAKDR